MESPITTLCSSLLSADTDSILFKVSVHKDVTSYNNYANGGADHYSCGGKHVEFAFDTFTENNVPNLIIYSFNQAINHPDFRKIARDLPAVPPPTLPNTSDDSNRERRQVPTCKSRPLVVNTSELFSVWTNGSRVLAPATFDARICGGICTHRSPRLSMSTHDPFIADLIDLMRIEPSSSAFAFDHCCAPVRYRDLRVISTTGTIYTIPKMILEACECVDVMNPV